MLVLLFFNLLFLHAAVVFLQSRFTRTDLDSLEPHRVYGFYYASVVWIVSFLFLVWLNIWFLPICLFMVVLMRLLLIRIPFMYYRPIERWSFILITFFVWGGFVLSLLFFLYSTLTPPPCS